MAEVGERVVVLQQGSGVSTRRWCFEMLGGLNALPSAARVNYGPLSVALSHVSTSTEGEVRNVNLFHEQR